VTVTAQQARELALALPEAVEQDHHGRPSFRVRGKIFATLWSEESLNAMPDEPEIHALVQAHPDVCAPVHWGRRLAAVRIRLPDADATLVGDVLAEAWARRAPAALRAQRGAPE
jgi:hypothetical protein